MRKIATVFVLTLFLQLSAGALWASVIDADLYTEFYSYKIKLPQDENHLRSLQGMKLGVRDAFIPGLSVFVRGRIASDLSTKYGSDPDFRVFGAYLEYSKPNRYAIKAGRQFVSAGLGGLTLDGGKLDLTIKKHILIIGYAGTTPGPSFFNYDEMNSWKESNAFGGRIKYTGFKRIGIGASYLERSYKDNLDSRAAGFDMAYSGSRISSSLRADYDLFWNRLKLLTLRPSIKCPLGHTLNLEYLYRKPSLGLSNVFSVFKTDPVQQFRINPVYRFNTNLHAFGSYAFTKFKNDDNTRVSVGVSYRGQSLGGFISDGYGGERLGVFGSLSKTINEKLQVYASGDMFNYKLDSYEDDTTPSLAASFGGYYKIIGELNTRAEMQVLSNRDYKYDTRLYLRLDYGFKMFQSGNVTGGYR